MNKCKWPTSSTEFVEFEIYDSNQGWNSFPGLYIFSYQAANGTWLPLYVGQTDDFSARLPSHERLNEAVQRGATHIHAKVVQNQTERTQLERALIGYLQPAMNQQLKQ